MDIAVEVLLAEFGSEVVLVTVAVLVVSELALNVAAVTLIVTTTSWPTPMAPRVQFTWSVEGYGVLTLIAVVEQEPCGVEADTYVVVDGMLSEIETFCATAGPALETISV